MIDIDNLIGKVLICDGAGITCNSCGKTVQRDIPFTESWSVRKNDDGFYDFYCLERQCQEAFSREASND